MIKKNKELLLYVLIMTLQIMVVLYWANCKVNYHIDELYSMGYASNYTGYGDNGQYITTSEDFKLDEWIENAKFKNHLIVSKEESVFNMPMSDLLKSFFIGRNYMLLLNVAESIAGLTYVSAMPGVILNILFFVIAEIFLILIMRNLDIDKMVRISSLIMFGFSAYMISAVVYVRFYMLVIMLMIIVLYCFRELWVACSWKRVILMMIAVLLLTYMSLKDSELTIPYVGFLLIGFAIGSLVNNKRKQLIVCIAVCMTGLIYVACESDMIGALIHPDKYAAYSPVLSTASQNIRDLSVGYMKDYLMWVKELLSTQYFGNGILIYALMAAFTIILIISSEKEENIKPVPDIKKLRIVTVMATVIWIGILGVSIVLGRGRFFCLAFLFVLLVVCIGEIYGFKLRLTGLTDIHINDDMAFMLVVAFSFLLFTVFDMVCQFAIWRYYCFGFLSFTLFFWFVLDRVIKAKRIILADGLLSTMLLCFVIINAVIPFASRKVETIYEEDEVYVETIRAYDDLDVVLVTACDEGTISRHELYDCVNLMPEDTELFLTDYAEYKYERINYPDEFMLWTHKDRNIAMVIDFLKRSGYKIEGLGSDHCSKAYLCRTL